MDLLSEINLYLAIEFKVNSGDASGVNDVAMCKVDITQTTSNGSTYFTVNSAEAIDTYVASASGIYNENINLSNTSDSQGDWRLL